MARKGAVKDQNSEVQMLYGSVSNKSLVVCLQWILKYPLTLFSLNQLVLSSTYNEGHKSIGMVRENVYCCLETGFVEIITVTNEKI